MKIKKKNLYKYKNLAKKIIFKRKNRIYIYLLIKKRKEKEKKNNQ